jgi:hypothetical protein
MNWGRASVRLPCCCQLLRGVGAVRHPPPVRTRIEEEIQEDGREGASQNHPPRTSHPPYASAMRSLAGRPFGKERLCPLQINSSPLPICSIVIGMYNSNSIGSIVIDCNQE